MEKKHAKQKCAPCEGQISKMKPSEVKKYLAQLRGWKASRNHHISKKYTFPDFKSALRFVNKIGAIAEKEGHHPGINFTWGSVEITIWTHSIDGLSVNDFILAARIEQIKR